MKKQQPKDINVRVKRAFRIGGEEVPVDTVVNLEYRFAIELIAAGKAERTNDDPRAPRGAQPPAAPAKANRSTNKPTAKPDAQRAPEVAANQSPVAPAQGE